MSITLAKRDVVWGYIAQFFSIASGLITLPLILKILSMEEIGLNYLMLTVGSLVSLFDFGFAPQFGRNITYVFSGVQELKRKGVGLVGTESSINYRLLATMIHTAKYVYKRLGVISLIVMLTLGSLYIYIVTDGFITVNNALLIWIVYSVSAYLNIYYSYYTALLMGKGLIMESKKAMVYSKIVYILLVFIFLAMDMGLLGVAVANLISPFVSRYLSYSYFFTEDIIENIGKYSISSKESKELFKVIWYNAKKLGFISVAASTLTYLSTFIIGLYLPLTDVASYGLMVQLVGFTGAISTSFFFFSFPKITALYVQNNFKKVVQLFSFSILIFFILYIIGSLVLFVVPTFLLLLKSNTTLPTVFVLFLCAFFGFIEKNQSLFSNMLLLENEVPFFKSSLITGVCIFVAIIISLELNLGILGVVCAQGIPVMMYVAWKWPITVSRKFNIRFFDDIILNASRAMFNKIMR